MHVLANSAALERKEVSELSASSPHLERHLGSGKDIDTDYRLTLNKQPEMCVWVMLWFPHVVQCHSFSTSLVWVILFWYNLVFTEKYILTKYICACLWVCEGACRSGSMCGRLPHVITTYHIGQTLQIFLTPEQRMCWFISHSSEASKHINKQFCFAFL